MAEHLPAVPGPNIFPDVLRVDADAVDEPLGIVVQSDLNTLVSYI